MFRASRKFSYSIKKKTINKDISILLDQPENLIDNDVHGILHILRLEDRAKENVL